MLVLFNQRVHLNKKLKQQGKELNAINKELELTNTDLIDSLLEKKVKNQQLNAKIAEMNDFLLVLNHDLIGPIRNIQGIGHLLKEKLQKDNSVYIQYIDRILSNTNKQLDYTNELIQLARYKSEKHAFSRVDCKEMIDQILHQYIYEIEQHNVSVEFHSPLPILQAEKIRIQQLFQNLIDNAIKFCKRNEPNRIIFTVKKLRSMYHFCISDQGIGIPETQIQHVFYAFRRGKSPLVAQTKGKGIGLATVKSIIENYNGTIWIESQENIGTDVYFTLDESVVLEI